MSLLAVIGESSMELHSQALTSSWTCILPRIIPAPQALLKATRPSRLRMYSSLSHSLVSALRFYEALLTWKLPQHKSTQPWSEYIMACSSIRSTTSPTSSTPSKTSPPLPSKFMKLAIGATNPRYSLLLAQIKLHTSHALRALNSKAVLVKQLQSLTADLHSENSLACRIIQTSPNPAFRQKSGHL